MHLAAKQSLREKLPNVTLNYATLGFKSQANGQQNNWYLSMKQGSIQLAAFELVDGDKKANVYVQPWLWGDE